MWSIDNDNTFLNSKTLNGSLNGFTLTITNITELFIESLAAGSVSNASMLACQADLASSTVVINIKGKLSHNPQSIVMNGVIGIYCLPLNYHFY